jgi:hypothetical protein
LGRPGGATNPSPFGHSPSAGEWRKRKIFCDRQLPQAVYQEIAGQARNDNHCEYPHLFGFSPADFAIVFYKLRLFLRVCLSGKRKISQKIISFARPISKMNNL